MSTTSTNMGLIIPTVSSTPGPQYATEVNASLTTIDAHTHTPGSGVLITPEAIDINSALPFAGNNATQLRAVRFNSQTNPLTGSSSSDISCIYVAGVDLYYNDGSGNQVRMTASGGVNGSPGSITNLTSPASVTYVSATPSYVFQSDANVAANLDGRNVILRNSAASSKGLTLSPPNSMVADIAQKLPTIPGTTSFVGMDSSGNMDTSVSRTAGVTGAMIAAVGQQIGVQSSAASSVYTTTSTTLSSVTGLQVTITTTGKPVIITLDTNESTSDSYWGCTAASAANYNAVLVIRRDGTVIRRLNGGSTGTAVLIQHPLGLSFMDTVSTGTYTYGVELAMSTAATNAKIQNSRLIAYELK